MFTISNGKVTKGQPDGHVFTSNEKMTKTKTKLKANVFWQKL